MDHCRRRKILGKSESGVMMTFPPKSDGDRCFGRNVGYGEGRPHHAALTLRIPIMRGDGGAFPPVVGRDRRESIAGARLMRQLGLVSLHLSSRVPPAAGPVMGAFLLSRTPDISCCTPLDA